VPKNLQQQQSLRCQVLLAQAVQSLETEHTAMVSRQQGQAARQLQLQQTPLLAQHQHQAAELLATLPLLPLLMMSTVMLVWS
jgi:predicted deacetylase